MKCLVLLAVAVPFVAAAAPLTIAHQGRLLAADGTALNGAHTLRMRLYDGASAVLYEDTFSPRVPDPWTHHAVDVVASGTARTEVRLTLAPSPRRGEPQGSTRGSAGT